MLCCVLAGCESHGFDLPKGVYLPNCRYGMHPNSQPARCMTSAEYRAEKEKARSAREEASRKDGGSEDPRYKEWIP